MREVELAEDPCIPLPLDFVVQPLVVCYYELFNGTIMPKKLLALRSSVDAPDLWNWKIKRRESRSKANRQRQLGAGFESLETRRVLATFVVNSLADTVDPFDGVTTLREAILAANSNGSAEEDAITFAVSGTITFTSVMPAINTPTTIDATTAPGYAGSPVVELNAGFIGVGQIGLHFVAGTSGLRGVALNRSGGVGVWLSGHNNQIQLNHIGTDLTGNIDRGNNFQGLFVNSNGNLIQNNLISGNDANGIWINGGGGVGRNNVVRSNMIGLNKSGTSALGNGINGVLLTDGAADNLISVNTIARNGNTGIWIIGAGVDNNRVQGNFIGTTASSLVGVGNAATGVRISGGASGNVIGTDGDGVNDASEGNLISGNGQAGVDIFGSGTSQNVVAGNTIGLDLAGTAKLANAWEGVRVAASAESNRIGSDNNGTSDSLERNVISGNTWAGVALLGAGLNRVSGNYIGTTRSGLAGLGNSNEGIYVDAHQATIGDNVVSGNGGQGITLVGNGTWVAGNLIGLAVDGQTALPNLGGLYILGGQNRIGTNADGVNDAAERNVIGSNASSGIWMNGPAALDNVIQGNYIGTSADGNQARRHIYDGVAITNGGQRNIIGTNGDGVRDEIEGNLISGSDRWGVAIYAGSHRNVVAGNQIGTNVTGSEALPNLVGVLIASGSTHNRVGSNGDGQSDALERNIVSGNSAFGIALRDGNSSDNTIAGNYIGVSAAGNGALANGSDGISAWSHGNSFRDNVIAGNGGSGLVLENANDNFVQDNTIGLAADGATALGHPAVGIYIVGARNRILNNIVSRAAFSGIEIIGTVSVGNAVQGNRVGTDATGTLARGNGWSGFLTTTAGILVTQGATNNLIGTDGDGINDAEEGNLISGNVSNGVLIYQAANNRVAGNRIGTNLAGTAALANRIGVLISTGASFNRIGANSVTDSNPLERNIVSGNTTFGIAIRDSHSSNNSVVGNYVGITASGNAALANGNDGISAWSNANSFWNNVIAGNGGSGLVLQNANDNHAQGNRIGLAADGVTALGHPAVGIYVVGARNRIVDNVVSQAAYTGIEIIGTTSVDNIVQRNLVGTDVSGTLARGNGFAGFFTTTGGILIANGATNNIIGTDGDGIGDAEEGNLISGNVTNGVLIYQASNNRVAGNRIGTNLAGTSALGNRVGVLISNGASSNRIGSNGDGLADDLERNVISGNTRHGVQVEGSASRFNDITGNFIGTNAPGDAAVPNALNGVIILGGAQQNRIGGLTTQPGLGLGNVISGNSERGVLVQASNNDVQGNLIGLNAAGTAALGNLFQGVQVSNVSNTRVGGTSNEARNIIAGNQGGFGEVAIIGGSGNFLQGNTIGTNGSIGFNVFGGGVQLIGAANTVVGGNQPGAGNLIAGVRNHGIWIRNAVDFFGLNAPATGNKIQGNTLGLAANGTTPLGFTQAAIYVSAGANGNWIGSDLDGVDDASEGNTITHGNLGGVVVVDTTTVRNSIQRNRIYSNGGLAIDLNADGVTPNDLLDSDTGPNQLTNYPVLRQVNTGSTTRVVGEMNGQANATYTLDFYANTTVASSGHGQAGRWLGSTSVVTGGNGQVTFDVNLAIATLVDETISMTATDLLGNTSELSRSLGLDLQAPTSRVAPITSPASSLNIPIQVIGNDVSSNGMPASGVLSYWIEVSINGAPYQPWMVVPAEEPSAIYQAQSGNTYGFRSIARDWAGNVESKPITNEAVVVVPDLDPPLSSVISVERSTPLFQIQVAGSDTGGSQLKFFEVYVVISGGSPFKFATLVAQPGPIAGTFTASTTFQAQADGQSYSYRFYSVAIDGRNNIEAAPDTGDIEFAAQFDPPPNLAVTRFDVNRGANQRSFIRHVDVGLNSSVGVAAILDSITDGNTSTDRIRLTRFNTDGSGSGVTIPLQGKLQFDAVDQVMRLDFGASGIGGNANSAIGNGYYRLALDLDGDGTLETTRHFYRLLGDTNGNRRVDGVDLSAVLRQLGTSGTNLDQDVNGDGVVNATDNALIRSNLNSSVAANLPLDD